MAHITERLELRYVRLSDVQPAPRNPRVHDRETIAASIGRLGFLEPVLLDERTGRLLAGHGRLEALAEAEAADVEPPGGIDTDPDGAWLLPVVHGWASKDDEEASAALVALNDAGRKTTWEPVGFAELLSSLGDLTGTGYDPADLDLLHADLGQGLDLGPTDPVAEWRGMPEFNQNDLTGRWATTIHFPTEDDAHRFWRDVLGEPKGWRRTAWWPRSDGHVGSSQKHEYVADVEPEPEGTPA